MNDYEPKANEDALRFVHSFYKRTKSDGFKEHYGMIERCLSKGIPEELIKHSGSYWCPRCESPKEMNIEEGQRVFCKYCGQLLSAYIGG